MKVDEMLITKLSEAIGEPITELNTVRGKLFSGETDYTITIRTFDGESITRLLVTEGETVKTESLVDLLAKAFLRSKMAFGRNLGVYIPKELEVDVRIKEKREKRWL